MKFYTIRMGHRGENGKQVITTKQVEGKRVHLRGVPKDTELFSHKDKHGRFRISEASSGHGLTGWELQLKGARVTAEINIKKCGVKEFRALIKNAPGN